MGSPLPGETIPIKPLPGLSDKAGSGVWAEAVPSGLAWGLVFPPDPRGGLFVIGEQAFLQGLLARPCSSVTLNIRAPGPNSRAKRWAVLVPSSRWGSCRSGRISELTRISTASRERTWGLNRSQPDTRACVSPRCAPLWMKRALLWGASTAAQMEGQGLGRVWHLGPGRLHRWVRTDPSCF